MASDRSKNTAGNYATEQWSIKQQVDSLMYANQSSGKAYTNHYAGDGLLMGRMGPSVLSSNFADIESSLRGIGANDLVNPRPACNPEFIPLSSLSVIDKAPVQMPEPLRIDPYQRPLPS